MLFCVHAVGAVPPFVLVAPFVYGEKLDFSCKVAERIHVGRNNTDRVVFLDRVAAIEDHRWIDIEETAPSAAEFEAKYGWAPRGRACNFQLPSLLSTVVVLAQWPHT
jgi:hypothetical protein